MRYLLMVVLLTYLGQKMIERQMMMMLRRRAAQ
jgi:hypothetical protein